MFRTALLVPLNPLHLTVDIQMYSDVVPLYNRVMGRSNRQQHKVPRCYLEAFTDDTGTLWEADQRYNLRPNKPTNVLTEHDYYTVRFPDGKGGTLHIEKEVLGSLETAYADIYDRVLKHKKSITTHDKAVLSLFIASMMERVPARREALNDFFKEISEVHESLKGVIPEDDARFATPVQKNANSIPLSELVKMGEDVGSLHSSSIPHTVAGIAPIIFDMKWSFMVTIDKAVPFITSDCPCVLYNPNIPEKSIYRAGLIQKNVQVTLPLSPELALLCGWQLNHDFTYLPVPQAMVHTVNKHTMTYATTLISNDKDFLEEYVQLEKEARGI